MAHHTVTLNYGTGSFRPDADVLRIQTGDTISFQLGTVPPASKFKITIDNPQFFSAAEAEDSYTNITVLEAVSTSYRCQLFDVNGNLLSRKGQPGAHMEPQEP
ncbi:MAG TPA: hypothetical protein VKU19_02400 [Bryobacteraceae bacterium]|nr:hypothetical protein [Bryobacteraceae bacterium]